MVTRLLLIGAGVIARSHVEAARRLPQPPRIAATSRSAATRAEFARHIPEAQMFDSVETMLALPVEPGDLVIVATPPAQHHRHTLQAFASGRHVLCEKPLATTAPEVDEMYAASRAARRHLVCCSVRYLNRPVLAAARQLLARHTLGQPVRVRWQSRLHARRSGIEYQPESRWFLDRAQAGGGCLADWGPYDLATLFSLLAPSAVTVESAWLGYPDRGPALPPGTIHDVEQQVGATLQLHLADGQTVRVDYERCAVAFGPESEVFQIDGPRGAIAFDWPDWRGHTLRLFGDDGCGQNTVETTAYPDDPDNFHAHRPVLNYAARLAGQTPDIVWDEQAWFNARVLCALYTAAQTGQPQHLTRLASG